MRNPTPRRRLALRLALLSVLACLPLSVAAQTSGPKPWSTIASAGEADEASQSLVDYSASFAAIKSTAPNQSTVVLRYNVVPVDGVFYSSSGVCKTLRVRFRDDGGGARVLVTLRRTTIATGATISLLTFDSDQFAPSANYQTQVSLCTNNIFFDFHQNTYWIEATLSRSLVETTVGRPGLQIIQLAEGGT